MDERDYLAKSAQGPSPMGQSTRRYDGPTAPAGPRDVSRNASVGNQLEDNQSTLLHLLSELRELEGGLNVVMAVRPPMPGGGTAGNAVEAPYHVLDRLQMQGELLRMALAHVQELRARLVL